MKRETEMSVCDLWRDLGQKNERDHEYARPHSEAKNLFSQNMHMLKARCVDFVQRC